jgi:hypothetical protein
MPTANKQRAHEFKRGDRLSARWAQKVENFITSFRVLSGGHFVFDGRNAVLQVFTSSSFTGQAYTPAGVLYDNLTDTSLPWVKYDLSAGVITQEAGPPSEPWGANESWRKKSDFAGAIYF